MKLEVNMYLSSYSTLADVKSGTALPLLAYKDSQYFSLNGYVFIGTATLDMSFSADKEMTQNHISALQIELRKVRAENESRVNEIVNTIKNLQALEYSNNFKGETK